MTDMEVRLRISGDGRVMVSETRKAEQALDRLGKETREAGGAARRASREYEEMKGRLEAARAPVVALRGAVSALGAAVAARQVVQYADAWTNATNSLKVVIEDSRRLSEVQMRLFRVAQETRQEFGAVSDLYGRLALGADELGVSQAELIQLTRAVGQAVAVSGSSTAEASGALLQFSQAMSSGVVRAEEFNSILEGAPEIARAAARGWEGGATSVAALRQKIIDGEVSSRQLFDALLRGSEDTARAFEEMDVSIGAALQNVGNSIGQLVGKMDDLTGGTSIVAGYFQTLSEAIDGTVSLVESIPGGFWRKLEILHGVPVGTYTGAAGIAAGGGSFGGVGATGSFATGATGSFPHPEDMSFLGGDAVLEEARLREARRRAGEFSPGIPAMGLLPPPGAKPSPPAVTRAGGGSGRGAGVASIFEVRRKDEAIAELKAIEKEHARVMDTIRLKHAEATGAIERASALRLEREIEGIRRLGLSHADEMEAIRLTTETASVSLAEDLERAATRGSEAFSGLGRTVTRVFSDMLVTGEFNINQLLRSLSSMVLGAAFRPLETGIESVASDLFESGGDLLSGLFGGFRADGGPMDPGKVYIVGERGPEPVITGTAARALPTEALKPAVTVVVNNTAPGTTARAVERRGAGGETRIEVVVEELERRLTANIDRGTGLARTLETRYGLDPAAGVRG